METATSHRATLPLRPRGGGHRKDWQGDPIAGANPDDGT
jgi:hypothetical protein